MISGSTTNSASDGIVKMMLAVTVVSRRSVGGALDQRAQRDRDQQARATIGISDSRRWITVSAQASSRWVSR